LLHRRSIVAVLVLCGLLAFGTGVSESGTLQVGAARVDITPAPDAALPMAGYASRTEGFRGIHDHVFVRAIVLDDGRLQAALVAWESLFVPDAIWADTSRRIAADTGIPPERLLLSAVHDHGAPTLPATNATPAQLSYINTIENGAVEAVRKAKSRLQPARFGVGTTTAYVNVNRREFSAGRGWWLGFNERGPSDKTVTVGRFEDLPGKPIAFWINYGVHAVVMGPENYQVTGDLAGATSRFVEQHYLGNDRPRSDGGMRIRLKPEEKMTGEGVVAVWTSGAAGDQNPVSTASGEDFTLVVGLGKILGEAVLRAASDVKTTSDASIRGGQRVVTCPGRRVEPGPTPRAEYKFTDADPVNIRLTLLTINDVALTGVSGEVFTLIAQRLARESRLKPTIMVTHTNGSSGYIPSDDAFEPVSYEVTASRLKPGCAENSIVNGFLELIGPR
jgi:neutral ceramidase